MAWTNPTTYSTGAVLTASSMNLFERDNTNLTLPAKSTVAGQMFYAASANTPAALAPSTSRYAAMRWNSTATRPAWSKDATDLVAVNGRALTTSGADPSTSTYTTYAKGTITLPVGWNSAKVLAWGSVYVGSTGAGGDTNAVLRGRLKVGNSFSTWRPSNALTTSENDTHAYVTHTTTLSNTTAITYFGGVSDTTGNGTSDAGPVKLAISTAALAGDVAFVHVVNNQNSASVSTHAQFTNVGTVAKAPSGGTDWRGRMMYRILTSTDPGTTYTFAVSGLGGSWTFGSLVIGRGIAVQSSGGVIIGSTYAASTNANNVTVTDGTVPTNGHGFWMMYDGKGLGATGHNFPAATTIQSTALNGSQTLEVFNTATTGALSKTSTNIAGWDGHWFGVALGLGAAGSTIAIQGTITGATFNVASFQASEVNWLAVRKT